MTYGIEVKFYQLKIPFRISYLEMLQTKYMLT